MSLNFSMFWTLTILMFAVACLFVVIPFVKFNRAQSAKGLKSDWYKSRLTELEGELQRGQFSQQEFDAAVTELKLTATAELKLEQTSDGVADDDAGDKHSVPSEASSAGLMRTYLIAAIVIVAAVVFPAYHYYGEQDKLVQWQAALERMPVLTSQVLNDQNATPSDEDLRDFALGLRTKLQHDPKAIGWMLLGRNLQLLGDLNGAIDAFDKSYRMDPNSIGNMVSLATALQQNGEPGDYKRSIRVLNNVLTLDPQNLTALILVAEGQMLDEQFTESLTGFKLVSRVMSPNDNRYQAVQQRIDYLSLNAVDTNNADTTPVDVANRIDVSINIDVVISASVNLNEFKTLFVFAKKPGLPMPLAVKKIPVTKDMFTNNTFNITLTESDVMVPSMSLANQPSVELFARLSIDDEAPLQTGDLEATLANLMLPSDDTVVLNIKKEGK
ncbi:c-type cytochrome biogenesis protein CcmI [Psychrosphaera aestuarii]|uniref:c-type cytochrome biogenesis protein CcmI n=1 Tax=Psychrosphaera aestuarii TaxID=1266052 RepID=UPI001B33D2DD|nr:c-type cytochrome biogenesis protein CcmI [Psychrosphaera aestuarii]